MKGNKPPAKHLCSRPSKKNATKSENKVIPSENTLSEETLTTEAEYSSGAPVPLARRVLGVKRLIVVAILIVVTITAVCTVIGIMFSSTTKSPTRVPSTTEAATGSITKITGSWISDGRQTVLPKIATKQNIS